MYVNDMVALEKDILMALEKQKEDERVQGDPRTSALIAQIYDTTKAHLLTMENHAAAMGGDTDSVWRMTGYALAYLPATLLLAALTVLVVGWRPRASGAGWGVLALCFVVGWLGSLLELPAWVNDLSPFTHVPAVPAEAFSGTPLVVLLLLGAACVAAGALGFRKRDILSS